ncbi:MAG: GNAT family N-acetyltransferase [Acidobacteriota bacterium]|nr:GNAT family N-acetyltransferase [Acidobacteriota bacterium]MDQ7088723.1 GNAT family N-acetyltransferase [Acidobacteriota bacterium]
MLNPRRSSSSPRPAGESLPGRFEVRAVGGGRREEAHAIVASDPVVHIHVGAFLWTLGGLLSPRPRLVGLFGGGELVGLIQHCRGLSWAVRPERRTDPRLFDALAAFTARATRREEVVIGPEAGIESLLPRLGAHGLWAREIRRQQMMAPPRVLRPRRLPTLGRFDLRPATLDDLPWLLETHGAMCLEDLGVDQVARHPEGYSRYFRELVREGRSLVGEGSDGPVFKAEIPLESRHARLVEGVYTLPAYRGRGFASLAMREILERSSNLGKRACLYVHRRNEGAIRLYRSLGFRTEREWSTMVVARGPGRRAVEI